MSSSSVKLRIHSEGEECYIEVSDTHSLVDVRRLILEEFDEEIIPQNDDGPEGFSFKIDSRYIQSKQECKNFVADLRQARIELVAKHKPSDRNKRKVPPVTNHNDQAQNELCSLHNDNKRVRLQECTENLSSNTDGAQWQPSLAKQNPGKPPFLLKTKLTQLESPTEDNADPQMAAAVPSSEDVVHDGHGGPEDSGEKKMQEIDSSFDTPLTVNDYDCCWFPDRVGCNIDAGREESFPVDGDRSSTFVVTNEDKHEDRGDNIDVDHYTDAMAPNEHPSRDIDAYDGTIDVSFDSAKVMNPHAEADEAKKKSQRVLDELSNLLSLQPDFFSETRRKEWLKQIQTVSHKDTPATIFGVLGDTGVGKSSLLNALLDEAAILPTSGSRGCTAAVVELVFHSALRGRTPPTHTAKEAPAVPVYQGHVEFMALDDWTKELEHLVNECSTQEKTIYARVPAEDMEEGHAAWQKIEQVYGKGYMQQFCDQPTEQAFQRLALHPPICDILKPTEPGQDYRTIIVQEGSVVPSTNEAEELLKPFGEKSGKIKRKQKKWAQAFRSKINSYVYRKGNGEEPQTWPLIRKVQLRGPWSVLSTGACLVDLPGVRDSNATRAEVAKKYLQQCNQIAIVAPIKRAVDDGTAKELLGEQFKRRLLMDGQYGNVFFVCTQTDDIEASETMRDHADVAQRVDGRWEKMTDLANDISSLGKDIQDIAQIDEDLAGQREETKQEYQKVVERLREEEGNTKPKDADSLRRANQGRFIEAQTALNNHRQQYRHKMRTDERQCSILQHKLKSICAIVRNEYSKSHLQEDFRSGLKDLYRKDDDEGDNGPEDVALPEEFDMDVFCTSANDYLKLMNIKTSRDGPPNTFSNRLDTQIPQLRAYVHQVTSRICIAHAKIFVENANDILDRMKLVASDAEDVPTSRSANQMKNVFETEMKKLDAPIQDIANTFERKLHRKIQKSLMRSLEKGAEKGSSVGPSTVQSWGSKSRRSRCNKGPEQNGLSWNTYLATVRRDGVYNSASAGEVDFNQELCDPMEREFATDWQSVFDATIRRLVGEAEMSILLQCTEASQSLANSFRYKVVDANRLSALAKSANKSTTRAMKVAFEQMLATAQESQRELSRRLIPSVQTQMQSTYESVCGLPRGRRFFSRMKESMLANSEKSVDGMFDDARQELWTGIVAIVERIKTKISSTSGTMKRKMYKVFSICWDDQTLNELSTVMQKRIRDCRDACLPQLNKLCAIQAEAYELLGIEREEVDVGVTRIETLEEKLEHNTDEAKNLGNAVNHCDQNAESPVTVRVKMEDGVGGTTDEQP